MPQKTPLIPERITEISELAEAVAEEYCPTGIVEPETIARAKGITFSYGPYEKAFDGMLEVQAGRFHIFCNLDRLKERSSPRARFTFAHELGHYYIDEHRNALLEGLAPAHGSRCLYESKLQVEKEADCFASNLLMPTQRFLVRAKGSERGMRGIQSLAKKFGTSLSATALRYAQADVCPCAVIKWDWKGMSWMRQSGGAYRSRFGNIIDSAAKLAAGSPTRRILDREKVPADTLLEAGTTPAAWFAGHADKKEEAGGTVLIEQAVSLGHFGVLTFLYPDS